MKQPKLSKLELQIMETFWQRGALSIREVQESFPEKTRPAYTTVQTMINRLEGKTALKRSRKVSNAHIFEATVSRSTAQRRLIDEFLNLFGGRMQPVMAHLVEAGKLTLEDVQEAEKLLHELAKKEEADMTALLLDHLWQSSVFAAVAGLLTLAFTANSAATRYWLWFAASIKFLIPFSALMMLGARLFQSFAPKVAPPIFSSLQPATMPFSGPAPLLAAPLAQSIDWAAPLLGLWALGSAALAALWLRRWLKLRATLAGASPLTLDAPMRVKSTAAALEPGLIGIWRPVLLLPEGIAARLSPSEMRAILAHEVCHLRRRDNLLAAVHMLVEALFWFHPLVWWLGTRLNAERENACDEAVLASGSDPQTYAEGILKVCQFYLHSPLACASGVSGADLKKRMETIMENRPSIRLNAVRKGLLAACAAAAIAAPLAVGLLTTPPAIAPAMAQTVFAPHPGTEATLRRHIEGWEKKQPALEDLTPEMVRLTREQQADIQKAIDDWGALKSITFKENSNGSDVYQVEFEHGVSVWRVQPLVDGKISGIMFQSVYARSGKGPLPGVEDAVRRNYQGLLAGAPAYDIMTPGLVHATKRWLTVMEQDAKNLGALKSLTFTRIDAQGYDVYAATFENGTASWEVGPLADGKLDDILWLDAHEPSAQAHPGTETSLRRYIESLEQGQPNYGEMTPSLADKVRQQLPDILATIKSWGALKSIDFKGGGLGGMDVYEVTFEHGKAAWSIAPLTANGKAERRGFQPLP